ncbi:hypothetical protein [Clostridium saccharoperbutylacetonicum]|uniref:hypothetical protein n=1 Tax=Clostridium saccharoperbutylacetonicum TaxID=36745 RepID=UPI0039EC082C
MLKKMPTVSDLITQIKKVKTPQSIELAETLEGNTLNCVDDVAMIDPFKSNLTKGNCNYVSFGKPGNGASYKMPNK